MTDTQETAIISDILSGNQEQYRFIVERYHRGLIVHLYNLTHDEQLAEDIAQEAFIKAHDKLAQYNSAYAFSTWLYKIADNLAYRQLKQNRHSVDIDSIEAVLPDNKPSLPEMADKALAKDRLNHAIQALPVSYKQVVILYYWDNFSYEEIAEIVERPIGTIRTCLYRAKEQLRKDLYGRV
jgi:RNA polymerase sigma factor (sigma-70 family)